MEKSFICKEVKLLANLIGNFIRLNLKETFYYKFFYIFEMISVLISLILYYYTSEAFSAPVNTYLSKYNTNYFSYIVLGEIFLFLPLFYLESPLRQVKNSIHQGVFDTFRSLPISPMKFILFLSNMGVIRIFYRIILTLGIALFFPVFTFSFHEIGWLVLLQLLIIPFCLGLGFLILSILLVTGRGNAALGYLSTMMAFFSGALFPVEVLPKWLAEGVLPYFPITIFLENSRMVGYLSGHELLQNSGILLLSVSILPVSIYLLLASLRYLRSKGNLQIVNY
jgi:hypothetical protein